MSFRFGNPEGGHLGIADVRQSDDGHLASSADDEHGQLDEEGLRVSGCQVVRVSVVSVVSVSSGSCLKSSPRPRPGLQRGRQHSTPPNTIPSLLLSAIWQTARLHHPTTSNNIQTTTYLGIDKHHARTTTQAGVRTHDHTITRLHHHSLSIFCENCPGRRTKVSLTVQQRYKAPTSAVPQGCSKLFSTGITVYPALALTSTLTHPAAMAGAEDGMPSSPFGPLLAEVARMRKLNLNAAIQDFDSIIDLLMAAREQVAGGTGILPL